MTEARRPARPVALVTGVGRAAGIGAAVAVRLAEDGWDVATSHWGPYAQRMPWGAAPDDVERVADDIRATGARTVSVADDLSEVEAPGRIFDVVHGELGPVTALAMCHCESVNSGLLDTTVASFDRHFAVNARGTWLLVREFASRLPATDGTGRILAMTSDHSVGNLPYGASKGAMDRVVLAAARELAHLRITANVINPGPVDTGWIDAELRQAIVAQSPFRRVGQPADTAALVSFLCSAEGGWINGQLLHSDGGLHA